MRDLKKFNIARRKAELNLKEVVVRITQLGSALFSRLNKSEPGKINFIHTFKAKINEAQEELDTIKENLTKIEEILNQQQKEKKYAQTEEPFRNR